MDCFQFSKTTAELHFAWTQPLPRLCLKAIACPFHAIKSNLTEDSITSYHASPLKASREEHLNPVSMAYKGVSLATVVCQMPRCFIRKLLIIATIILKKGIKVMLKKNHGFDKTELREKKLNSVPLGYT